MNNLKKIVIIICTTIVLIFIYRLFGPIIIVSKMDAPDVVVGIIDGNITSLPDNVVYNKNSFMSSGKKTHGDKLIELINLCYENVTIYYYNAADDSNIIDTESIIDGLKWISNKNINYVNISLSSKFYSDDIQKWINDNSDIQVFSSYNNIDNSYDYPSMYDNVISSTIESSNINVKKIDKIYRSNRIIVLDKFKQYKGNSFLSILTTIDYAITKTEP